MSSPLPDATISPHTQPHGSAPAGDALLGALPAELQKLLIDRVLDCWPQPATDIWYQDESTGTVFVLRRGVHWELNNTAAAIRLGLGKEVSKVVEDLVAQFPDADPGEIRFSCIEFLLQASARGLIELFPPHLGEPDV